MTVLLLLSVFTPAAEFDLYLLAGQSNMEGYGTVAELPEELRGPVEGAFIYQGNLAPDAHPLAAASVWVAAKPGHGTGYSHIDGEETLSQRFGPELTFATEIRKLRPERHVASVKYAKGGSSVAEEAAGVFGSWDPHFTGGEGDGRGINQYDQCLAAIAAATSRPDVDGDGEVDTLIPRGIVWMQGESDATQRDTAETYAENLAELMALLRASLRDDSLPIIVGRISDSGRDDDGKVWDFLDTLHQEQQEFVRENHPASIVLTTEGYAYSDAWHYDTAGYIDLGQQFAALMNGHLE